MLGPLCSCLSKSIIYVSPNYYFGAFRNSVCACVENAVGFVWFVCSYWHLEESKESSTYFANVIYYISVCFIEDDCEPC